MLNAVSCGADELDCRQLLPEVGGSGIIVSKQVLKYFRQGFEPLPTSVSAKEKTADRKKLLKYVIRIGDRSANVGV